MAKKRVSSTAIGAFVLASLGLLAIVVVILSSGKLFSHPHYYICMFQGNLNGLKVGAPVKVKGVQIGTVQSIGLRLKPDEGKLIHQPFQQAKNGGHPALPPYGLFRLSFSSTSVNSRVKAQLARRWTPRNTRT